MTLFVNEYISIIFYNKIEYKVILNIEFTKYDLILI
jgi:hypothetical protein